MKCFVNLHKHFIATVAKSNELFLEISKSVVQDLQQSVDEKLKEIQQVLDNEIVKKWVSQSSAIDTEAKMLKLAKATVVDLDLDGLKAMLSAFIKVRARHALMRSLLPRIPRSD